MANAGSSSTTRRPGTPAGPGSSAGWVSGTTNRTAGRGTAAVRRHGTTTRRHGDTSSSHAPSRAAIRSGGSTGNGPAYRLVNWAANR